MRTFFSMGVLYLFYYFCKYNLGATTPVIQKTFGLSSQAFGWITTTFTLVYAGGQFINGFLGDRYGPKLIMILGGFGGVVANVLFGLSGTITFFVIFCAVNGYFSSCGWALGSRILFNWFPENRWGTWMGVCNALCYTGAGLVYPIATYAASRWGWRSAFFISPAFLLAMTVAFIFLGKSSPQEVGLQPEWEQARPETPPKRTGALDASGARPRRVRRVSDDRGTVRLAMSSGWLQTERPTHWDVSHAWQLSALHSGGHSPPIDRQGSTLGLPQAGVPQPRPASARPLRAAATWD